MKKKHYMWGACIALATACSAPKDTTLVVKSPNARIEVQFSVKEGTPGYSVLFDGKSQIARSEMGFVFQNQPDLSESLTVVSHSLSAINETWEMPWGEQREVLNACNELRISLTESSEPNRSFDVVFRVFDDGVGFRYEFSEQEAFREEVVILDEKTEFTLTSNPTVWWQPGDWDIYEHLYNTTRFSEIDALSKFIPGDHLGQTHIPENSVNTPVTMKTDDGVYLSFHEADLTNYADMTLKVDSANLKMVSSLVGNKSGIKVRVTAPFVTPWRTIQIADRAGDLIESRLILNLNDPNELGDISGWFKPMKYVGIWWDMHLGTKTWDYASGNHGATTAYAKELIDFAAANNIGGLLVEGWNTGWETWTHPDMRDTIFDFTTPYPDYDLKEVVRYGKEKGVELIMHHETSAAVQRYEERLDTAYQLMQSLGVHAVKTGYVGVIVPEGEYHHGQWMVNHFQRVVEHGAQHQVAINMHEPIKATGKRRTYPNEIAREALRGQEYNAWAEGGGSPPEHLPIVAFTRMLAGPIDYTPGIFNLSLKPHKEDHVIKSTLAQQLALYVVIYSPIQMAADLIQYYKDQPAFQFIRDVAVDWEQTHVLDGEVGDFVVIARQQRDQPHWFVGGITDENPRDYTLTLDFLEEGKTYTARIYQDTPETNWENNPTAIAISEQTVKKSDSLNLPMAGGGGFAVSLMAK